MSDAVLRLADHTTIRNERSSSHLLLQATALRTPGFSIYPGAAAPLLDLGPSEAGYIPEAAQVQTYLAGTERLKWASVQELAPSPASEDSRGFTDLYIWDGRRQA